MNIDLTIMVPLIGVVLGWLLGNLSGFFKVRRETQRILGRSISRLYYILDELSVVVHYLESVKDRLTTEEYEAHRQMAIERHTLKSFNSLVSINELIDDISSISPGNGIELKGLLEGYLLDRKLKFNAVKKDEDKYLYMLSLSEMIRDETINNLYQILLRLSFKYNLLFGVKMKRRLRNVKANREREGIKVASKIYELYDDL